MTHHYTATHSNGVVHLRKTERTYTHAAVSARRTNVSWAGRRDLARKAGDSMLRWDDTIEVVPVAEVSSADFARLTKASKRKFKTTFMGKLYTTTIDADCTIETLYPVGVHHVAHTQRYPVPDAWLPNIEKALADAKARHAEWGNQEHSVAHHEERLARVKAQIAKGYHEVVCAEHTSVYWARNENDAQREALCQNAAAFKLRQRLEAIEV